MTREEVKNIVRHVFHFYEVNAENCNWTDMNEACEEIFKALKQEPVIDKIRAEIKALSPEPTAYDVVDGNPIKDAVWETLADVLQIIDKYKGESEG